MELQTIWGWQPALYLFLGGMGAGAFVAAAYLFLKNPERHRRVVAIASWAAVGCLVVGLLCLLSELTAPARGLLLWQSFSNFTSWMTFGAWIVVAALVCIGIIALLTTEAIARALESFWPGFAKLRFAVGKVFAALGLICSLGVAVYTGLLLMSAPGVPLWNTWLLPCLFTVSALDTGVALVEVISMANRRVAPLEDSACRVLERAVVVLVISEICVLIAFFALAFTGGVGAFGNASVDTVGAESAELLVLGGLAPWFWGLVFAAGLVCPLIAAIAGLASHHSSPSAAAAEPSPSVAGPGGLDGGAIAASSSGGALPWVGALGAIAGGCALRFLVVMAGLHADPVADATAQLFQAMVQRLG